MHKTKYTPINDLKTLITMYETRPEELTPEELNLLKQKSNETQKKHREYHFNENEKLVENYDLAYLAFVNGSKDYKKNAEKKLTEMLQNTLTLASLLCEKSDLKNKILYDITKQIWYKYESEHKYVWSPVDDGQIQQLILNEIQILFPQELRSKILKKTAAIKDILSQLQILLQIEFPKKQSVKIAIYGKNETPVHSDFGKLESCKPTDYVVNYNPIEWEPGKKSTIILDWLKKTLDADSKSETNSSKLNLFRAIAALIMRSNGAPFYFQILVEIYGAPISGKSLLARLLTAIVGKEGYCSTNLEKINESYELDKLAGKNLCICPDQPHFTPNTDTVKRLTGGDTLTARPIYGKPFDFRFYGVLVIVGNSLIKWGGTVQTAIERRRIEFEFKESVKEIPNTELLDFDKNTGEIFGEWKDDLPGFIQWIFEMPINDIKREILTAQQINSRTPKLNSVEAYIKNYLMPFKDGKIGWLTDKYGPPLYYLLSNYLKRGGKTSLSPQNMLASLKPDFGLLWPNYTIEIFEETEGPIISGITYQNILNETNWKTFRAMYKHAFDKNFFGKANKIEHTPLTLLTKKSPLKPNINNVEAITIENLIETGKYNLYVHLNSICPNPNKTNDLQECILYNIGTPVNLFDINPAKFYSKTFNYETFIHFKGKDYEQLIKPTDENDQPLANIDENTLIKQCLYEWFEPDHTSEVPTIDILNTLEYFLLQRSFSITLNDKKIKSVIKILFHEVYPEASLLEDATNITKRKLHGLRGLKKKKDF